MQPGLNVALHDPDLHHRGEDLAVFRRLRAESPVHWCPEPGFWAITKYADALRIHRDPETFCSGRGMTMRGGELSDVAGGETLITTDPPRHTQQRRLVSREFTPAAVTGLAPRIRAIVDDLFDAVPDEPFDFVPRVAAQLPIIVIAEMLGVPIEDREQFIAWSNASIGRADHEYATDAVDVLTQQYEYFVGILDERRREPRTDLVSALVGAVSDDLTEEEVLRLCFLLLAAGNETTRNLISRGLLALIDHPEQVDRLRASEVSTESAVEEMLRFCAPVIHMARTTTRDVTLGGHELPSGSQVVMFYASVNRDEEIFGTTAEAFDVGRDPNPHLSFGFGQHFCLGAALARLEATAVFDKLLRRFSTFGLAGDVAPLRSTMIRGIKHMPVWFARARGDP